MIERITSAEFSSELLSKAEPIVITDAIHGWDIETLWSPAGIAARAQDARVSLCEADGNVFGFAGNGGG